MNTVTFEKETEIEIEGQKSKTLAYLLVIRFHILITHRNHNKMTEF